MSEAMATRSDKRRPPAEPGGARERVLRTAYELFSRHSLNTVGVDRIVAEADVAKTTLYRHFPSKDELAVSVLERHEQVWTRDWLERNVREHKTAGAGLLAVFDAFDDWFRRDDFRGCLFANALLETRDAASPVHTAAATGLRNIRALISSLAEDAGVRDPDLLARQLQMLLLGAIVYAVDGQVDAARQAREVARALLERDGVRLES
jgi:AcrR family transcriptional regulator